MFEALQRGADPRTAYSSEHGFSRRSSSGVVVLEIGSGEIADGLAAYADEGGGGGEANLFGLIGQQGRAPLDKRLRIPSNTECLQCFQPFRWIVVGDLRSEMPARDFVKW